MLVLGSTFSCQTHKQRSICAPLFFEKRARVTVLKCTAQKIHLVFRWLWSSRA